MAKKRNPVRKVIFSERFVGGIDLLIALSNARVKLAAEESSMSEIGVAGEIRVVRCNDRLTLEIHTER